MRLATISINSGCSALPRNLALEAARGKYIYFLDSDDLLSETALAELYDVAEKFKADVVHCDKAFAFFDADGVSGAEPIKFQTGEFVTEPTLETFDIGERVTDFTQKKYLWWACNKLFRRKLLIDNKITFPAIRNYEDFVVVFKCLCLAKNYVRVPFVSYYYRIREDSLSHEGIDIAQFVGNLLVVVKSLDDFMSGRKFFEENLRYKYEAINFFMQERLDTFSKNFMVNHDISDLYEFFSKKIFSVKPQDNVALTAYLFMAANVLKLYTTQQEMEIYSLRNQVDTLKKIILEVVN